MLSMDMNRTPNVDFHRVKAYCVFLFWFGLFLNCNKSSQVWYDLWQIYFQKNKTEQKTCVMREVLERK